MTDQLDMSRAARKARRERADRALSIALTGLVRSIECFDDDGKHYRITTSSGWRVDFWPGSEKWREPGFGSKISGQGFEAMCVEIEIANAEGRCS